MAGRSRGFTLVELLVAIGIFAVVVVIVSGSIASVIDANKKAQTITSVVNNLNFTLEAMTRAIKTGENLAVASTGAGGVCADDAVTVEDSTGTPVTYRYNATGNGSIDLFKDEDGDGVFEASEGGPITAPEIQVDSLCFYMLGGDQPAALFLVEGAMELGGGTTRSEFHVQTTVAQRALQIPG